MRPQRVSFQELVHQNKQELMRDEKQLEKIEKQIDEKHMRLLNPEN